MDKHITNRTAIFSFLFCFASLQNIYCFWPASTDMLNGRQVSEYLSKICQKIFDSVNRIYLSNGYKPMFCGFLSAILFVIFLTPLHAQSENRQIDTTMKIGGNRPVRMARATWDTGWFQAEVYRQLLLELGYQVERPRTFNSDDFYRSLAVGGVDFWANGWFPQHNVYLKDEAAEKISIVGIQVKGGALQGYLIDKKSADALNITSLDDFKRAEVCDVGWNCGNNIETHLEMYQLHDTVEQVQGDYSPLMLNAIELYNLGEPILAYSWTPSWMVGELIPKRDIVWLNVPLPVDEGVTQSQMIIPDVTGCTLYPCSMGYPSSDIRAVANRDFLEKNRAIQALLESVIIPLDEISAQNSRQIKGEGEQRDIERHATEWIASHRIYVDSWLAAAIEAHDEAFIIETDVDESTGVEGEPHSSLRVVTKVLEPFVIYDTYARQYTGFSIELWDLIAREAGFDYELYNVNTVAKLLDEVERGAADVATTPLSITVEREKMHNFSHPYFDSGLQVLVAEREGQLWGQLLVNLLLAILSPEVLKLFGILFVCLLVAAHVMWFSERHVDGDFSKTYWLGIWEAFWWSAVTATTVGYGDKTPKTVPGRLVGLIWMFSGLFILASFTAGIATTFAVSEINANISDPSDLFGKRVATIERSTAEMYLEQEGIRPILFQHERAVYKALLDNKIDAFVYDAPVLEYYVNKNDLPIKLASEVFQKQYYAFALSHHSGLREEINLALLHLIESGEYNTLRTKWFGE